MDSFTGRRSIPTASCEGRKAVLNRDYFVGLCAFLVVGCQTLASDEDRPARIIDADDASRTALQETLNRVLGTNVTLSDTALTDRSVLTFENWPIPTMENPVPQGRIMKMPIQFRLMLNGTDCILIDNRDDSRHLLENTTCIAE